MRCRSGELIAEACLLSVVDGRPPLTDTLPDGVTPRTPRIGLELAIDLHVGLFDACVGAGVEGQLE